MRTLPGSLIIGGLEEVGWMNILQPSLDKNMGMFYLAFTQGLSGCFRFNYCRFDFFIDYLGKAVYLCVFCFIQYLMQHHLSLETSL